MLGTSTFRELARNRQSFNEVGEGKVCDADLLSWAGIAIVERNLKFSGLMSIFFEFLFVDGVNDNQHHMNAVNQIFVHAGDLRKCIIRGRSPVEWGDFPSVRPYVRLSICPSIRPSIRPSVRSPLEGPRASQAGLRPSQSGLRASQAGLRARQAGLRACQPGLRASQPGLIASQPGLRGSEACLAGSET